MYVHYLHCTMYLYFIPETAMVHSIFMVLGSWQREINTLAFMRLQIARTIVILVLSSLLLAVVVAAART